MSFTNQSSSPVLAPSLVYPYEGGLYVNLTSRCPTACRFCIKFSWNYRYRGHLLQLSGDPSVEDIVKVAKDVSSYREVVFCGYGESTYRLAEMRELAGIFHGKGVSRVRLNTVGLGNLIHGRDITPNLAEFLDAVSISLNTVDPERWVELMRPLPQFREKGLSSVLEFIECCARRVPDTTVTAVEMPGVDAEAVRRAAESRGAQFRLRPYLDDDEDRRYRG